MADQSPLSKQPEKDSPSVKTPVSSSKQEKGVKRKQLFSSVSSDDEKKSVKAVQKRRKTTSQPGSPTLLGTPGRTIPFSERQQLFMLQHMTACEESPEGQTSPQKAIVNKPSTTVKNKVNNQNNRGETSLHLAAIKGDVPLVESLISQGADVNAQDYAGWTALHEASNHGFYELANILLEAGAQVNALGSKDFTPLHDAAVNGHREVVQSLLKHGADPLLQNKQGQSALDLACNEEISNLMRGEIIQSASEESDTELQGPTSPESLELDQPVKKNVKTDVPNDPYDFDQENSNGQKITIHWRSPDKTGKDSYMEITRKIVKVREPSTPVSFSSSSTSDSELLDPQLTPIIPKEYTSSKEEEITISKPTAFTLKSVELSELAPVNPSSSITNPLLSITNPSLSITNPSLNIANPSLSIANPSLSIANPKYQSSDSNGAKELFISEDVKEVKEKVDPLSGNLTEQIEPRVTADYLANAQETGIKRVNEAKDTPLVVTSDPPKVSYTIPKPVNESEGTNRDTGEPIIKLTIRLSQDSDLICETSETKVVEKLIEGPKKVDAANKPDTSNKSEVVKKPEVFKKVDYSKKSEQPNKELSKTVEPQKKVDPVQQADMSKKVDGPKNIDPNKNIDSTSITAELTEQPLGQATGTKHAAPCDSLQSTASQLRLQVVSEHSSSSESDLIREWRILPRSLNGDSVGPECSVSNSSLASAGLINEAGDAAMTGIEVGDSSISLPATENSSEKQPQVKDKTKKHKDKSQKSHKRHKHSHSHTYPFKEEQPELVVESSSVPEPVVIATMELKKINQVPAKKVEEQETDDSPQPAARAYYIVQQKQPTSSNEIKKLLLRTSGPTSSQAKQENSTEEVTSSIEGQAAVGEDPEPDSTVASEDSPTGVKGGTEKDDPTRGSAAGSPSISSSDQTGQGSSAEEKPQKPTRTLRSNTNLQNINVYGSDNDKEKEGAISQPMTRSRRNQLEAAASTSGTMMLLPEQNMDSHPRKRKMVKHRQQQEQEEEGTPIPLPPPVPIHEQVNSMEAFMNIRREVKRRQRANLVQLTPNMPPAYNEYLIFRKTYLLQSDPESKINRAVPKLSPPVNMGGALKAIFESQEKQRHSLRLQHQIEREKLMLATEQDVLRVYGRGARALANQTVPFSACTILKDEEVYSVPEPLPSEDSKANNRQRFNGRQFYSWLHDVDEKYEKIKEDLLNRHQQEAASLYAIQKFEWELKLQELKMWDFKSPPTVSCNHVPMVEVDRDFDLLPA